METIIQKTTGEQNAGEVETALTKASGKTDAEGIAKTDRLIKAIRMRREGFTYFEIARDLGWKSEQAACKAVSSALDRAVMAEAQELKMLSIMRLESCVAAVLKKAQNGNLLAVDRLIRISKREGEILGFDEGKSNDLNVGFEIIVTEKSEEPKRIN